MIQRTLCWFNIYHEWSNKSLHPLGGIVRYCLRCNKTENLIFDQFYNKLRWKER